MTNRVFNKHKQFMLRVMELAKKAEGKTFPNPLVGAVVVKNGKIISEGYHRKAGTPHAEIIALRRAKRRIIKGADLYINLEPCAHYGRTPPCVNSIIKSGLRRVYVAMKDPNPLVNGKGLGMLRKNGISVKTGICRESAKRLNKVYIESVKSNSTLQRRIAKGDGL